MTKLKDIKLHLFNQISSAASNRDIAKVDELSSLAKECDMLETKSKTLETAITAFNRRVIEAVNGSASLSRVSAKPTYSDSTEAATPSRKAVAAQVRNEWVAKLQTKEGISLHGHGKQYQTASGQSVAVAFSHERLGAPWPWFLGLRNELPDVAVLLCKSHDGRLYDIVLPVQDLRKVWDALKKDRKHIQVKFNVNKKVDRFFLRVPDDNPLDITGYIGNYDPLR